jgi:hypothetical protein
MIVLAGLAALAAVSAPASAQTPPQQQRCGVAAYSVAEQKYVTLPCTAEAPPTEAGKPACGVIAYSVADQKYVGVPCAVETPNVEPDRWAP